jgi:hypothetical protein
VDGKQARHIPSEPDASSSGGMAPGGLVFNAVNISIHGLTR